MIRKLQSVKSNPLSIKILRVKTLTIRIPSLTFPIVTQIFLNHLVNESYCDLNNSLCKKRVVLPKDNFFTDDNQSIKSPIASEVDEGSDTSKA